MMRDHERLLILRALGMSGGSRTMAARSLGITRRQLYKRVRVLRIALEQIFVRPGRPGKLRSRQ